MATLRPIATFSSPSPSRAWQSKPHPTLPLLATATSDKTVRISSLTTFAAHSVLEGGHKRSVRSVDWVPNSPAGTLGLVTGSFDATAGVWRRYEQGKEEEELETEIGGDAGEKEDWEFSLVLEGHDSEIKGVSFSPSGQYLATCSRDKSVWIWEEVGAPGEDEWETVAVLQEHEQDVKCVAWCGDVGGDDGRREGSTEVLASGSYDDTVRLWREDGEGEWGCVAVLTGHDGTVWGVDWEAPSERPRDIEEDAPPMRPRRLATCSADSTVRIWHKTPVADPYVQSSSSDIPSTMRPAPSGEQWVCEAVLPKVHERPIYSVAWSGKSGRIASTGGDSLIVVYEERPRKSEGGAMEGVEGSAAGDGSSGGGEGGAGAATEWHVVAQLPLGHGPYEINHVVWCPRFDGGRKGEEEMLVSTGDDGVVRAWEVRS